MRVQENFEHFATEGLSCEKMSLSTENSLIYVSSRVK